MRLVPAPALDELTGAVVSILPLLATASTVASVESTPDAAVAIVSAADEASEVVPLAVDVVPPWLMAASFLEAAEIDEEATESSAEASAEFPPPHPTIKVLIAKAMLEPRTAPNVLNRMDKSRKEGKGGVSTFSARPDGSRRIASLFGIKVEGFESEKTENPAAFLLLALRGATTVSAHDCAYRWVEISLDGSACAPPGTGRSSTREIRNAHARGIMSIPSEGDP